MPVDKFGNQYDVTPVGTKKQFVFTRVVPVEFRQFSFGVGANVKPIPSYRTYSVHTNYKSSASEWMEELVPLIEGGNKANLTSGLQKQENNNDKKLAVKLEGESRKNIENNTQDQVGGEVHVHTKDAGAEVPTKDDDLKDVGGWGQQIEFPEEWFDKPGEIDKLEDFGVQDAYGLGY